MARGPPRSLYLTYQPVEDNGIMNTENISNTISPIEITSFPVYYNTLMRLSVFTVSRDGAVSPQSTDATLEKKSK